jgi:hypothetical protein
MKGEGNGVRGGINCLLAGDIHRMNHRPLEVVEEG